MQKPSLVSIYPSEDSPSTIKSMLKINFLGDSITEGAMASRPEKTYVSLVGQLLPCEARNYGIGGTRFARQKHPSDVPQYDRYFASRVESMKPDADFVFVFGGTNDWGHGDAPLGKMGDTTPDTFYGALEDLIQTLLKHYKKEQIVFILPLHRFHDENPLGEGNKKKPGPTLDVYVQAILAVTKKENLTVLDFRAAFGPVKSLTSNPLIADGIHPNDRGHLLLAELIVDYLRHCGKK